LKCASLSQLARATQGVGVDLTDELARPVESVAIDQNLQSQLAVRIRRSKGRAIARQVGRCDRQQVLTVRQILQAAEGAAAPLLETVDLPAIIEDHDTGIGIAGAVVERRNGSRDVRLAGCGVLRIELQA